VRFHAIHAATERDFPAAFESLVQLRANALIIGADGFFTSRIALLAELAIQHALPAISSYREFAMSGGLLNYGTSLTDAYRQVGRYTAKILSGEKPAELPVIQPTKFELVINLSTAKRLNLTVPVTLQAAADEGVE
jgi:putative ABC transport system substrate-binding protein